MASWIKHILTVMLLISLSPAVSAQANFNFLENDKQQNDPYESPSITKLPTGWWVRAKAAAPKDEPYALLKSWSEQLLAVATSQKTDLSVDELQAIRQFNINITALSQPFEQPEENLLQSYELAETYGLSEVLDRMQELRQLNKTLDEQSAVIKALKKDISQQKEFTDQLIIKYQSFNADARRKSSIGYQWLESRSWVAIYMAQVDQFERQLIQTQTQIDTLSGHIGVMKQRLQPNEQAIAGLEKQIEINQQALASAQQAALQSSLNMAKNPDKLNSSLIEKNKLNLAQSLMAQKRLELAIARDKAHKHWIAHKVDSPVTLQSGTQELVTENNTLIQETRSRLLKWRALVQDALLPLVIETEVENTDDSQTKPSEIAQQMWLNLDALDWQIDKVTFINSLISHQLNKPQSLTGRLFQDVSELTSSVVKGFKFVVNKPLFRINETPVTLLPLLQLAIIVLVGYLVSKLVRLIIKRMESPRGPEKSPVFFMLDKLIHYLIIFVATLAGFTTLGIDFSNLTLIAGALSVGIGFGLQNIVSNFVSGLTIMFERTLKVGDYIEIEDGITGTVKEINARSTRINTNDNIDVVIPNSDLVTNQVINWTLRDSIKRVKIQFGVAYGSDKDLVKKAAVEAAQKVPYTLTNMKGREPDVWMTGFGDNSLDFQLLVWVSKYGVRRPNRIKASFLWQLDTAFNEYGIEVPFPQRVLHEAKPKEIKSKKIIQTDQTTD